MSKESQLLSAIRYSSLHFNDATTPEKLRLLVVQGLVNAEL